MTTLEPSQSKEAPGRNAWIERELDRLVFHDHHREELRAAKTRVRVPKGRLDEPRLEAEPPSASA
jgi:hypothetical protein